jgi:hypothetical protein
MFRELTAIMTSQLMMSRSLICLLENENGGKLYFYPLLLDIGFKKSRYYIFNYLIYQQVERFRYSNYYYLMFTE